MPRKADIGATIGIDGEAEFKRSVSQINSQLKTLGTDMARVTSAFLENDDAERRLTAENVGLADQMTLLQQKADILTNRLAEMDKAGVDPLSSSYQKLLQDLNNNETAMNKTQAQIAANEKEIQSLAQAENENADQTEALTGDILQFGEGAGGVSGILKVLGIDVSALTENLGLSKQQTGMMREALNGGGMSLAVAAAAAAAAIALAAKAVKAITEFMADAVRQGTEYADNISTLSTNFHISAQKLQEYQYMAELTDTSLDTITGSIARLTKSMGKARSGNEEVNEAFAKLNIRVTDANGTLRDSSEVFEEAVGALNRVHNETERDTIAMTLFGRSAMELNSLVQSMADGSFKQFQEEARAMGYVLSDEEIGALSDLDDQFEKLQREQEAIKNQISAEMAPALLELTKQLLEVAQSVDWREFGKMAADTIRELTPLIIDMANAVAGLAGQLIALHQLGQTIKKSSSNDGILYRNDGTIRENSTQKNNYGSGYGYEAQQIGSQSTTINVQLDSQTIARATYVSNLAEANRRGKRAIS